MDVWQVLAEPRRRRLVELCWETERLRQRPPCRHGRRLARRREPASGPPAGRRPRHSPGRRAAPLVPGPTGIASPPSASRWRPCGPQASTAWQRWPPIRRKAGRRHERPPLLRDPGRHHLRQQGDGLGLPLYRRRGVGLRGGGRARRSRQSPAGRCGSSTPTARPRRARCRRGRAPSAHRLHVGLRRARPRHSPGRGRWLRSPWMPPTAAPRLHLVHRVADEAAAQAHRTGWRYQLGLFRALLSREVLGPGPGRSHRPLARPVWAVTDPAERRRTLEEIATPDLVVDESMAALTGHRRPRRVDRPVPVSVHGDRPTDGESGRQSAPSGPRGTGRCWRAAPRWPPAAALRISGPTAASAGSRRSG